MSGTVRLRCTNDRECPLPPVCVCCGQPAVVYRAQQFHWRPDWIGWLVFAGGLPYFFLAELLSVRRRVALPLCRRHRFHWLRRSSALLLALVAVVFVLVAWMAGLLSTSGLVSMNGAVLLLGLLLGAMVLQRSRVRPRLITPRAIVLSGVSESFAAAVRSSR